MTNIFIYGIARYFPTCIFRPTGYTNELERNYKPITQLKKRLAKTKQKKQQQQNRASFCVCIFFRY